MLKDSTTIALRRRSAHLGDQSKSYRKKKLDWQQLANNRRNENTETWEIESPKKIKQKERERLKNVYGKNLKARK